MRDPTISRWPSSVVADDPDDHAGRTEVDDHLFWLIVPTITAPVSTNVINPASTAASSGSTEVSACPLTVLAKGSVRPRSRRVQFKDTGTAGDTRSAAQDEEAVQPGAVGAMVLRGDVAHDVVVPERRSEALGRIVLRRDHVEVVEVVGDLALELRAATGRERHAVLGAARPDVLPAARPRETGADLGAVPRPCGLSRASGPPGHDGQPGEGHGGEEDAGDALESDGSCSSCRSHFPEGFGLIGPDARSGDGHPHGRCPGKSDVTRRLPLPRH